MLTVTDDSAKLTVERGTYAPSSTIALLVDGKDVLRVPQQQNASVVLSPGNYNFRLLLEDIDSHADLPELTLEVRGRVTLVVSMTQPSKWESLIGEKPKLDVHVVIDEPRPWPTIASQFWVGHCVSTDRFWEVFGERKFPEAQTDEEQWAQDDTPISLFAEMQGETYIDHDFTEGAYVGDDGLWRERLRDHSWSAFWADEALQRATTAGHSAPNAFFMCTYDTYNKSDQIQKPRDIRAAGIDMTYIGQIVHRTE